ncbi:MAG: hypothetical protein GX605_03290 [Chloroflexi bacterium]|nr:hypothetical protein [Chloroflexota bacterium]
MEIRDYQERLTAFDRARGWDRVLASQTMVHLVEEVGEVARVVLELEGYREADDTEALRTRLREELADAANFLFKLASHYGVEMEQGLLDNLQQIERRFPLEASQTDMARYIEGQRANLRRLEGLGGSRHG